MSGVSFFLKFDQLYKQGNKNFSGKGLHLPFFRTDSRVKFLTPAKNLAQLPSKLGLIVRDKFNPAEGWYDKMKE